MFTQDVSLLTAEIDYRQGRIADEYRRAGGRRHVVGRSARRVRWHRWPAMRMRTT